MKTILLLAAMMLSVPCFAQKSSLKVAMERIDACEGAMNYVMDDNIAISNDNAELRIKIADLEKQLEESKRVAKFAADLAVEAMNERNQLRNLILATPLPEPMPYPVYINPPNVTVQPKIVIDRDPVKPFTPAPVVQDKQIFCTTQTYGNTEYTSCN